MVDKMGGESSSPHCLSCAKLQEAVEASKKEHVLTLKMVKEKIISTDELIKKYQQKCLECDKHLLQVTESTSKLEAAQMKVDNLQSQLEKCQQTAEPLRKNVTRLHRENTLAESTISELREKLQKTEKMYSEVVSIAKVKEEQECAWRLEQQVQAQELQKLRKSVDKGGTNLAKLQEQLKKEKEQNKELNRSLAAANRKVSKLEQQLQQAKENISSLKIDVDLVRTRRSIEGETAAKARKQRRSRQSGEQFAERPRASNPDSSPSRFKRVEHVLREIRESVELPLSPLPPSPEAHSEVDSSGSEPVEMTDGEDSSDDDEAPSGKSDSDSSLGDLADMIFRGDNEVTENIEEQPLNGNGAEFNENLEDSASVDASIPVEEKANLEQENKKSANSTLSPKEKADLKEVEALGDTESGLFSEDRNSDQFCSVSQLPQDMSAVNRTRREFATCAPRVNISNPRKERRHVTGPEGCAHMTRSRSKATENSSSVESDRLLDQETGGDSEPNETQLLDDSSPKQTDFKETTNVENDKGVACKNSTDRINTSPAIVPDTQQAIAVITSQTLDISFEQQTDKGKEATDVLARRKMTSDAIGIPYFAEDSARLDSVCDQSVSEPAMLLTEKDELSMSSEEKPLVATSEEVSFGGHDSETLFASKTRIEESSSEKTRETRDLSAVERDNSRSCEKETLKATPKEVVSFNNGNKSFAPDEKVQFIEDNLPQSQHEVKTQIEKTSLEENNNNVVKDSEHIPKQPDVGVDSVMTPSASSELNTETKLAVDLLGSSETSNCLGEGTVVTSALHNIEEKGIKTQITERLETHEDVELSIEPISSAIKIAIETIETSSSITGADMSRSNYEDNTANQVSLKCDERENVHSAALSSLEDGSLHKTEHVSASANTMINSDGVSVSLPEECDVTLSQSEKVERDIHNVETRSGQISRESHTSPDEKIKSESLELSEGTAGEDMVGSTDEVSTAGHSDFENELSVNKTDNSVKVGSVNELKEQEFVSSVHENKGKQKDVIYSTPEPSVAVDQSVFKDSLFRSDPTCKNDVCLTKTESVDEIKEVDSNACCNELKETSRVPLARKQKCISHNITNSTTQEHLVSVSEGHSVASDTFLLSSCSENVHLLDTSFDENTESLKVDVALGELKDPFDKRMKETANSFDTTKATHLASLNTGLSYNSSPILSLREAKAPICMEKISEDADSTCLKVCHTSLTRNPNDDQSLSPRTIDSPIEYILDSLEDFCADFPPLSPLPPSPTRCDEDLGSDAPLSTCGWLQEQPNADDPAVVKDTSGKRGNCSLHQTKKTSSKASDGVTACKAVKRKIVGDRFEVRSLKACKMESLGKGSSSTADRRVGESAVQKNLTSIRDLRKPAFQSGRQGNNQPKTKAKATPCDNSVKKNESSKLSVESNTTKFKARVQKGAIEKRLKNENSVQKNENSKFPVESNATNSKAPVEKYAMEKRPKNVEKAESSSDDNPTVIRGDLKGKYPLLLVRPGRMPEVKYVLKCLARMDEDDVELDAVIGRLSSKRCISSTTPVASAIVQFLKHRREEDLTNKILHQLESNQMEWQPMLTDFEGRLVNLVCGLSEHVLFQNFTPQLVTLCCRCLISSCRGCSKEELKGLLSLSRMLTALCKLKEDLGCVRVLCYDLIRSLYDLPETAVELVIAVIAVWPQVLQSPSKGYRPLLSTIKTVLLSFVHESSLTGHCNILRKLCLWEDEQYVLNGLTDLGSELVEWLKNQRVRVLMRGKGGILVPEGVCFGVVKSLELLSCVLGWKWTLNTLIINNIWEILKTWASEETNSGVNLSSTAVTDTVVASEPDINSSQKTSEVKLKSEGSHDNFNMNKSSVCSCQIGAWTKLSNFENCLEKTKGFSAARLQDESMPGYSSCTDRIGDGGRVMEQSGEMFQFCLVCGNLRGSILPQPRVILCIQLLGRLCRIAVENCQSSVPEIIDMLCGLMEQSSVTTKVTYHIQLAAAMSLLDMSPWQPERVAATIKKWLAARKTSKSFQVPTCVTQGLVCLESIFKSNGT